MHKLPTLKPPRPERTLDELLGDEAKLAVEKHLYKVALRSYEAAARLRDHYMETGDQSALGGMEYWHSTSRAHEYSRNVLCSWRWSDRETRRRKLKEAASSLFQ